MVYSLEIWLHVYGKRGLVSQLQDSLRVAHALHEARNLIDKYPVKIDFHPGIVDPEVAPPIYSRFDFNISSKERDAIIKTATELISEIGPSDLQFYVPYRTGNLKEKRLIKSVLNSLLKEFKKEKREEEYKQIEKALTEEELVE